MYILQSNQLHKISGGNPYAAVGIAVGTYVGIADIIDSTVIYNNIGSQVGETVFNLVNPNPLGVMIYTIHDFK